MNLITFWFDYSYFGWLFFVRLVIHVMEFFQRIFKMFSQVNDSIFRTLVDSQFIQFLNIFILLQVGETNVIRVEVARANQFVPDVCLCWMQIMFDLLFGKNLGFKRHVEAKIDKLFLYFLMRKDLQLHNQ